MIVKLLKRGTSFKGAWQYYFHDKMSEEDQSKPKTSNRVQYSGTLNLGTKSPELAWRIMSFTQSIAQDLKEDAGLSNRGRKSKKVVLPIVLSYGEGQYPGLSVIGRDIQDILEISGLDQNQVLWAAHNDTANFHVHMIVNTVDHRTGMVAQIGKNIPAQLQKWAHSREKDWGRIDCPRRLKAAESKQFVPYAERRAREIIGGDKDFITLADALAEVNNAEWKKLRDDERAFKSRRKKEISNIYAKSRLLRNAIKKAVSAKIQFLKKKSVSPVPFSHQWSSQRAWKKFGRRAVAARRMFFRRERTVLGPLVNAVHLAIITSGGISVFDLMRSQNLRQQALEAAIETEMKAIAQGQANEMSTRISKVREIEKRMYRLLAKYTEFRLRRGDIEAEVTMKGLQHRRAALNASCISRWDELVRHYRTLASLSKEHAPFALNRFI